jgi:nicastrin
MFKPLLTLVSFTMALGSSSTATLDEPFQTSFASLSHSACISLFYRGGRMGCSTESRDVQTGELQYFDASVKYPVYKNPFVLVMDEADLTSENVQTAVSNNRWGLLKGILVLNNTDDSTYYSPGPLAPQGRKTPSKNVNYGSFNYAWNSIGDGLYLSNLFGTPIAFLNEADVSSYIRQVSQDSDSEIVAEFNYYMGPETMDSPTCLSWIDNDDVWRPKCLPLGGTSVWATAGSPEVVSQRRKLEDGSSSSRRPVVMVTTAIDSTSMFHDLVPAANTAASNILTLLMAAKILGASVDDATLDALPNRILFGFFQGETYGFIGSRAFLRDVAYPGFQCDSDLTVRAVSSKSNSKHKEEACLYPLRHSLEFQKLGNIAGMIAVDQVGLLATANTIYAQTDGSNFGGFISNVLQAVGTNSYSAAASNVAGTYFPPSPLTSLLSLSGGAVGGAILTGYNDVFVASGFYESRKDSVMTQDMDLDAIAAAATLLARSALAAAYDDGSYDSDTASSYALNLISETKSDDKTLLALANCLYLDGSCEYLHEYARAENLNEKLRSGLDFGIGMPLGTPPNYYVGVYNADYGQPFVQVEDKRYGAYNGDKYGKQKTDAFSLRPTLLEQSIRGMLNDFLGRGSVDSSGSVPSSLSSCSNNNDCSSVSYCAQDGDHAVCTAKKVCVCSRSHYHLALDEALEAAPNNFTGYFQVKSNDKGISAMYTEANWDNDVGVRVYRNAGRGAGFAVLGLGLVMVTLCAAAAAFLQRRMKKEKLY